MSKGCIWTEYEEQHLIELSGRIPLKRISSIMGRSQSSIIAKAHSLGVSIRVGELFWSEDRLKRLADLRAEGKSWAAIGVEFERTPESCRQALMRHRDFCLAYLQSELLEALRAQMRHIWKCEARIEKTLAVCSDLIISKIDLLNERSSSLHTDR